MDITNFVEIKKREVAYFLGFMWADGYIRKYTSGKTNHHKISLEINETDAKSIQSILEFITKWAIFKRKRKETWQEAWTFSKNSKELYNFLESNDYVNKSTVEPTKILSLIPESLKIYFWKGVIDGDGSAGLSGRGAFFELASTYDYQYLEFNKWLLSIGTFGTIYKQISKRKHKSSVYKIYGKKILNVCNVLPNYGLLRKNKKFKEIRKKYEK